MITKHLWQNKIIDQIQSKLKLQSMQLQNQPQQLPFNSFSIPQKHCLSSTNLVPITSLTNVSLSSCFYILTTILKFYQKPKMGQKITKNAERSSTKQMGDEGLGLELQKFMVDHHGKIIIIADSQRESLRWLGKKEDEITYQLVGFVGDMGYGNCFKDFQGYFKRVSGKNNCDFKLTLLMVETYCECSKIQIADQVHYLMTEQYQINRKKICEPISRQRMSQMSEITGSLKRTKKMLRQSSISTAKKFIQSLRIDNANPAKGLKFSTDIVINPQSHNFLHFEQSNNKIKQSSTSTAYKSSFQNNSVEASRTSFCNKFGGGNIQTDPYKIKPNLNLFSKVQQADSQSQMTSKYQQSRVSDKRPLPLQIPKLAINSQIQSNQSQANEQPLSRPFTHIAASVTQSQLLHHETGQRILALNNWDKKVSRLTHQSNMKQSYTVEIEGDRDREEVSSPIRNWNQNAILGKLARVVVKSMMPIQGQ